MMPVPRSIRVEGSGTAEALLSAVAWKVTIPAVLVVKSRENWVGSKVGSAETMVPPPTQLLN
jgi:hypothetical protein